MVSGELNDQSPLPLGEEYAIGIPMGRRGYKNLISILLIFISASLIKKPS